MGNLKANIAEYVGNGIIEMCAELPCNPDGSSVLILTNCTEADLIFNFNELKLRIPPRAIQTWILKE